MIRMANAQVWVHDQDAALRSYTQKLGMVIDAQTADEIRTLMAKGFARTVFLTTDDCNAAYEELRSRDVEFTEAPEERPYGIDAGLRDPSGNSIRLTQVCEGMAV
jgi:catechol 2,3-dioxygenase-like lactoylglutathione lyase family enzyme